MMIQPRKTASLPKYAAVLAAAVMLTGCGYDDLPAFEGTAPDPAVELMGETQLIPELTAISAQDAEPEQTTTVTTVTDEPVMLDGDVVMLDGDVDIYDGDRICTQPVQISPAKPQLAGMIQMNPDTEPDIPDFQTTTTGSDDAEQKQLVSRWEKSCRAHGWMIDDSTENYKWFGNGFQYMLCLEAQKTAFLLYDGRAADSTGLTMREWSDGMSTEHFDWGSIMPLDDAGTERIVFVDISGDPDPELIFKDTGL